MPWRDELEALVRLGEQRKQSALAQALRTSRRSQEKLDEAQELRRQIDSPPPRLMPEFQLDRPQLFARLRGVAVMQAHRAEVELHANALQSDAEALQVSAAQQRIDASRHHARREKFSLCLARMELERRRDHARREETTIQEAFACRV